MKITNMRRVNGSGKVRAFFYGTPGAGDQFNDFNLIEGAKSYFAAPPSTF